MHGPLAGAARLGQLRRLSHPGPLHAGFLAWLPGSAELLGRPAGQTKTQHGHIDIRTQASYSSQEGRLRVLLCASLPSVMREFAVFFADAGKALVLPSPVLPPAELLPSGGSW